MTGPVLRPRSSLQPPSATATQQTPPKLKSRLQTPTRKAAARAARSPSQCTSSGRSTPSPAVVLHAKENTMPAGGSKKRQAAGKASERSAKIRKTTPKVTFSPGPYKPQWEPVGTGTYKTVFVAGQSRSATELCFDAIRHRKEGEVVCVKDNVKISSSEGLENIAKVARIYLDKATDRIMLSVLWYYTPGQLEHPDAIDGLKSTEQRHGFPLGQQELLISRHFDTIMADSIESLAYVLSFNEYCRFQKAVKLNERLAHVPAIRKQMELSWKLVEPRQNRLPESLDDSDFVYFCRSVYNISNQRIRVPQKPGLQLKPKYRKSLKGQSKRSPQTPSTSSQAPSSSAQSK
ncbi:bromo adjacent domain-containing 1 protein-like protein [Aphelenchoides avenae]|nr:bromo adjacent domain-containing 1 protein-like protein [Aphelenchus avenae]